MSRHRHRFALLVALNLSLAATAAAEMRTDREQQRSALALELRLLAPCCWVQTLDVHDSELAAALRLEIEQRLARGEASTRVEDDLAARYGERIRAVPRGDDPRDALPIAVGVGMLASVGLLIALAAKWRRKAASVASAERPVVDAEDGEYGELLEQELSRRS